MEEVGVGMEIVMTYDISIRGLHGLRICPQQDCPFQIQTLSSGISRTSVLQCPLLKRWNTPLTTQIWWPIGMILRMWESDVQVITVLFYHNTIQKQSSKSKSSAVKPWRDETLLIYILPLETSPIVPWHTDALWWHGVCLSRDNHPVFHVFAICCPPEGKMCTIWLMSQSCNYILTVSPVKVIVFV